MIKHSGAEWVENARKYWQIQSDKPISALGRDVANILGQVYGGIYHLDSGALSKADWSDETFIKINLYDGHADLATHDGNNLIILVLLCFMLNVRLKIDAIAYRYIQLQFCRVTRAGFFRTNHPMLDQPIRWAHQYLAAIIPPEDQLT